MKMKSEMPQIAGKAVPVRGDDIDTDRIIPARFMKTVTFEGLGKYAFYDARFDEMGRAKKHPFNDPKHKGAVFLIVNRNFGSGSSREHAPQALKRFGIKAIIGESFAEIFANNCTTIGIPAVTSDKADINNLMSVINDDPALEVQVDLETNKVSYGDFSIPIKQQESSRIVLLQGRWDSLAELKEAEKETKRVAESLPYLNKFE